VGLDEVAETHFGRIDAELLGELVEMHFHRKARLRGAVPALGAAGRLVGERARPTEPVGRHAR
jgi:hypothetical protein